MQCSYNGLVFMWLISGVKSCPVSLFGYNGLADVGSHCRLSDSMS